MAKTQYELLVEQANKPRKAQTIKPISMDYNPTSFSGNSGNGLGFSAPSARRNTNTGYVGSVMSGGTGYGGTNYGSSSTKKTGSSTAQMIANADPYMDEQTRNVINSTQETFSKVRKPKQMKNSFNDTLNYAPSSTVWQTNGESTLYGFSGGGYKSTPTVVPTFDDEEEYVYNGPNYMDQLRSLYNSLYGSNIDAANSAYAQLKAEAERQALIKKGQAHTRKVTMGKYVPETLRAMGLKNNGLAADALIGIDNNYMNYLMQALAQEENAKAEASRYLAEQTRAANNQKALWDIELLGKQQDAWTMLQQMAASGDYGEEFLQNYGYSWGFDENQVGNTLDVYKKVLAKQEAEKSKANNSLLASEVSKAITSGNSWAWLEMSLKQQGYTQADIDKAKQYYGEQEQVTKNDWSAGRFNEYSQKILNSDLYTVDSLMSDIEKLKTSGELYGNDYARLEQLYVAKKQKGMGALSASEYESRVQAILNGTYVASKNNEDNNILLEREAKNKAVHYEDLYGVNISDDANVVNINGTSFSSSMFGDYWGTGRENSNQSNYINKIVTDAKAGKIKEGQTIKANLGVEFSDYGVYIYLGNGIFIEAPPGAISRGGTLYVPDGYKETAGRVQKK